MCARKKKIYRKRVFQTKKRVRSNVSGTVREKKNSKMFRTTLSRLAPASRCFSSGRAVLQNENKKVTKHIDFLSKFYSPELLQSIKITESLVDPKEYLEMKKRGGHEISKVAPSNPVEDYSKSDPKWEEAILYPNQANNRTPYPEIPQIQGADRTDLKLRFDTAAATTTKGGPAVNDQFFDQLHKLTGMEPWYMKKLYVRPIVMKRVSCQTSKGKIPNFYALTVVGDKNGMIGLGEGKSRDGMRTALYKAHWNAIKNLGPIPRYENRTIIGDIDYKFHAVKLFIKSAPAGFGLRVNPNIFEVCQAAGIKDLRGKVYKSRNPMNVVKGFVEALTKQTSLEDLAAGRGKKLVDLRKVYYSA